MPTSSPRGVDQRAAGIAEVDRGVGLDEILVRGLFNWRPIALTMPIVTVWSEAERIADREHDVAGAQRLRSAISIAGRLLASILSTARSVSSSAPTSVALAMRPSYSTTWIVGALGDHVVVGEHVAVWRLR